jgi:divalent metal cation (Fe/Co/Zn/Cd) transporter
VDLDICVDKNLSLDKAHEIGDITRNNVFQSVDKILEVRVHIDPQLL